MEATLSTQLTQQIVETLKTICDHDINFIDIDGRIRASTDPERVGGYHVGGHEAARSGRIVTIEQDDPARELRHGINMPIRFHGKTVAVIGITGPPAELRRYADLAQRLTLLLLREHEMDAHTYDIRTQTSHLVRALTDGEMVNTEFLQQVLQKNGLPDDGARWRTVIIQMKTAGGRPLMAVETAIQGAIDRLGSSLSAFLYPGQFRLLLPDARFAGRAELLRALAAQYPDTLQIAVGSARRLLRQDRSCRAAELALRSLEPGQNYAVYESMRMELLLGSVAPDVGTAYLEKCLQGLDADDKALLAVYFAEDQSLQQTAAHFYLHKNTLQYRLGRIRARCGLDPRAFRDGCVLYTALCLERMRAAGPKPPAPAEAPLQPK